jgi:cystathionine gamma-synthase
VEFVPQMEKPGAEDRISSGLCAVVYPSGEHPIAKQFWQHSGEGISSRRAEFCQRELEEGLLAEKSSVQAMPNRVTKGPKRYSRMSQDKGPWKPPSPPADAPDTSRFVEERFGRNLDLAFVRHAKLAVQRRIAGTLRSNVGPLDALSLSREGGRDVEGFTEADVFLYPTGMSAIFNSHRILMLALGAAKSVCYGYDACKLLGINIYSPNVSGFLT